MRITSVAANNRKKMFEVRTRKGTYPLPYAKVRVRPTPANGVVEIGPDEEMGSEAFTYRLADGQEDTVHLDAVLEYNEDPNYLAEVMVHRLTVAAQRAVDASGLSKRELIRRLGTSASQFYRLLDPTYQGKSVGQLLALLHLVGKDVDVVERPAGVTG